MTLKTSKRGLVPPFIVMDVMREANRAAASGAHVIHLEVGQPSTGAPREVIEASRRALLAGPLGYTEALGMAGLRDRIAQHYQAFYGVTIDASRVVVTVGASGAFILAFLAAFDAGDRVALAAPGYPAYRNILTALGIEPVLLPASAEDGFQPTVAYLEAIEGDLAGLIVASPSNPTGTMIGHDALEALGRYCGRRGIRLVSDEIYHGITYGASATTAASVSDDAIVINSFSKYFSMTGWRLGWMVLPPELLRPVECLAQNLFISPPTASQEAAIAAFDCFSELDENVRRYATNRRLLVEELPTIGFANFVAPDGAFYLYADVGNLTEDSLGFCRQLLAETGIAVTPGIDFDPLRGNRFLRFSFAGSTADVEEAITRLRRWHNGRQALIQV